VLMLVTFTQKAIVVSVVYGAVVGGGEPWHRCGLNDR
jgi:hypothetical protein